MANKKVEDFISSPPSFSSISGKGKSEKSDRAAYGWDLLNIISGGESKKMLEWMINHTNEGHKYQSFIDLKKLKAGRGVLFFFG
jgi:hypothetical protein